MVLRLFFLFPVAVFPEQQVGSEQIEGDSECFSVFPLTDSSLESDGKEIKREQWRGKDRGWKPTPPPPPQTWSSKKNPLLIRRQSETFIYHQECVDVKPIPAELTEGKEASEGE